MSIYKESYSNKNSPLFISHRVNTLKKLKETPQNIGIEIDVRDYNNKLIISHDPFTQGEFFTKYIDKVKNRFTILNIKSSGLVNLILKKIKKKNNYFFLDLSFTEIHLLVKKGFSNKIILRFSKYEKFDLQKKYFKNIKWIWYDYFDKKLLTKSIYNYIKKNKKKICIVSPDLLGANKKEIIKFINYLNKNNFKIDAVCTKDKYIKTWSEIYKY